VKIVRVTNQGREVLRYLSETGIELGATGLVEENNAEAGVVGVRFDDRSVSMGHTAAAKLLVEPLEV